MNNNIKTINLFWIIFMGHVEAEAGMRTIQQAIAMQPVLSDTAHRKKTSSTNSNIKKRKQRKKP
jgi:hypothetical protein